MKREREQSGAAVGGPARRRRGRFAKHSGAWKTVEGTEERKTVAKLLQFFQTAAQPSPRAAIGFSPVNPTGDITTQFRSHGSFALRLFLCRLALSSANSEIKLDEAKFAASHLIEHAEVRVSSPGAPSTGFSKTLSIALCRSAVIAKLMPACCCIENFRQVWF